MMRQSKNEWLCWWKTIEKRNTRQCKHATMKREKHLLWVAVTRRKVKWRECSSFCKLNSVCPRRTLRVCISVYLLCVFLISLQGDPPASPLDNWQSLRLTQQNWLPQAKSSGHIDLEINGNTDFERGWRIKVSAYMAAVQLFVDWHILQISENHRRLGKRAVVGSLVEVLSSPACLNETT